MNNVHELRDSQRKAYEELLGSKLRDLIASRSQDINDDYRLDFEMFPIDREAPISENGTDYYLVRAKCTIRSKINEGSASFYVDLLKLPVLYETGFRIGGNYMQLLDSYERTTGWAFSAEKLTNEKSPTITARALGNYGKNFEFLYDSKRIALVNFKGLVSNSSVSASSRILPVSVFLRAVSRMSNYELLSMFGTSNPFIAAAFSSNNIRKLNYKCNNVNDCIEALSRALLGENKAQALSTVEMKQREIDRQLFSARYFNLGTNNAKRFNNIQSYQNRAKGKILAQKLEINGKVYESGLTLTNELLEDIDALPIDSLSVKHNGKVFDLKKFSNLTFRALGATLMHDVDSAGLKAGTVLGHNELRSLNDSFVSSIKVRWGRSGEVECRRRVSAAALSLDDIYTAFSMWMDNLNGLEVFDKQYELTNRICVAFDDIICDYVDHDLSAVFGSVEKQTEYLGSEELLATVISDFGKLIDTDQFINRIRDTKAGGGQTSEMCNIVSYISKSNKIYTNINPMNINPEMLAVQDTQEGRLDPFDVPESNRIGSVHNKTVMAECDENGYLMSPYLVVKNGEVVSDDPVYLTAIDESGKYIAAWDETFQNDDGTPKEKIKVRCDGDITTVSADRVSYKEYSPLQTLSIPHAMITFAGHSNAKRLTMGCNQLKQAMITVNPARPFVGTGCESVIDFGTYDGKQVLHSFYEGYRGVVPELEKYKDRIMNSVLTLTGIRSANELRTLEFNIEEISHINEETGSAFDSTAELSVPYAMRNFQEGMFSYRLNHTKDRRYLPGDIIAYNTGYSLEDSERVDLVDYGAYQVEPSKFSRGLALGQNLVVGYKTCEASTTDDSILISDSLVYTDKLTHIRLLLIEDELRNSEDISEQFTGTGKKDYFDHRGLPFIGTVLKPGDACIAKQVTRGNKTHMKFVDLSPYEEGQVIRAEITVKNGKKIAQVLLAGRSSIECGDKLAGRHGNKGVVAKILPAEQMPFDPKTGRVLDICLNPLGVPSRLNISQLLEVPLGMCRLIDGKQSYVSPYHKDDLKFVKEQIEKFDVHPVMMVDGRTGKKFKRPINVGVIYLSPLQQTAVSGIHAIGLDAPVDPVFLQPKKGAKNEGGQSFGEMENWCLHGVGANKILRDLYGFQSDDLQGREALRDNFALSDKGEYSNVESVNSNDTAFQAFLRSMGVELVTDSEAGDYRLVPMSDQRVMALSGSPVTRESELHSAAIFGRDDSIEDKSKAKRNWSWIDLGVEMIHPIWLVKNIFGPYIIVQVAADDASVAFKGEFFETATLSNERVRDIIEGKADVVYKDGVYYLFPDGSNDARDLLDRFGKESACDVMTGIQALVHIYKHYDMEAEERRLESSLKEMEGKKNGINSKDYVKLVKKLNVLKHFNQSGEKLSDYVITTFPVMPTSFRPIIELEQQSNSLADFDQYYRQILNAARDAKASGSSTAARKLYDRLCEFTGIGNQDKKKKYKDVLNYFAGVGDSKNHGKIRSAVQSKRIFCSGRATITPADYRIRPTQLGVPASMLVKMGADPLAAYFASKRLSVNETVPMKIWKRLFLALASGNFHKFVKLYNGSKFELVKQFGMTPGVAYRKMRQWIVDFFEGKDGCEQQIVIAGRQPSLHRYSIRAFKIVVLWTKVIQINSLVCKGYNADFDGDKMWLSLCMTADAREEALDKITPMSDMINPKNSTVMLEHTQDISLGCYVATMLKDNAISYDKSVDDAMYYSSLSQLEMDIFDGVIEPYDLVCFGMSVDGETASYLSTAGRILFNSLIEEDGFTDREFSNPLNIAGVDNSRFKDLAYDGLITCGKGGTGEIKYINLQDICKDLYLKNGSACMESFYAIEVFGFRFSDMFSVSISIDDMNIESGKEEILADAARKKAAIEQDFLDGLIAADDKRAAVISLYSDPDTGANNRIEKNLIANLSRNNNLFIMMDSGARGNKTQIMHMCGAIGVLEKSKTESMDDSITSNYYEGLSDFDVHMTSYSARTGVASTQRETRNAGYATRKVVYMTNGTKIVANDCGKTDWWYEAVWDSRIEPLNNFKPSASWFEKNLLGRETDGRSITEEDFQSFADNGFNSIRFSDGQKPESFHADPYLLVGSKLVDETGTKYFGRLVSDNGEFNNVCADVFDHYKLKSIKTSFGEFSCRYKLDEACRSQLMYREARDIPGLEPFLNQKTNERINVITEKALDLIEKNGTDLIPARVMLDCECKNGICAHCYGLRYSNLQLPEVGDVVGVESAQAIGEPAAQLTMNVINKGGVAGASIASGIDVFSAYLNGSVAGGAKSMTALVPKRSGYVRISKMDDMVSVAVEPSNKDCDMCVRCIRRAANNRIETTCPLHDNVKGLDAMCMMPNRIQQNTLLVKNGEWIESGYPITSNPLLSDSVVTVKDDDDPRRVLRRKQMIWILNYFNTFRSQSISINVRHFELLAMVQNQYVTIIKSDDPAYEAGNVYNVKDVDLYSDDIKYALSTLSMNDVILRNSGLLTSLTFAKQVDMIAKSTVSNYRSSFATNSSPVGLLTIGQNLDTNDMKLLSNPVIQKSSKDRDAIEEESNLVELEQPSGSIQLNEMEAFDFESFNTELPDIEPGMGALEDKPFETDLAGEAFPDDATDFGAKKEARNTPLKSLSSFSRKSDSVTETESQQDSISVLDDKLFEEEPDLVDYEVHYYFDGIIDSHLDEFGCEESGFIVSPSVVPDGYELVGKASDTISMQNRVINFLFKSTEVQEASSGIKNKGSGEKKAEGMSVF